MRPLWGRIHVLYRCYKYMNPLDSLLNLT